MLFLVLALSCEDCSDFKKFLLLMPLNNEGVFNRGGVLEDTVLKSLALASRPQVLENCPVLGSRTALFFELLKFCGALEKFLENVLNVFLWRSLEKFLWRPFFFFFGEHLPLCPWSLASSIPVLGLESVCPRKGCPWPRIFFCAVGLGLEPWVLDSTSGF